MDVFSQIRDMDDEEDEDERGEDSFSHGIVWGYFEQAEDTFNNMKAALWVQLLSGRPAGVIDGR